MQIKQINEYRDLAAYTGSYKFLADPGDGLYYSITMDKLSPVEGSTSIDTLGTITTGVWNGTPIADSYIASASTWNAKSDFSGSYNDLTDVPTSYSPSIIEQDTNNRFVTDAEKTTWDNKLDLTGGIIDGNLIINGDVSASGSSFIVNAQTVEVEDNLLVINNGETGAGVTSGISGIEVDRGTSTDYQFVFEESSNLFKIGEIGDLQRVATFSTDSISDGYFTYFNSAENGLSAKQIDYLVDLINVPTEFTPESHTHTLSEVTDSGTIASKDYWTGTQDDYDNNLEKNGVFAQSADIAIIIG